MKLNFKNFGCLLLLISIMGCTSQGNKNQEVTNAPAVKNTPKNFERPTVPAIITNQQEQAA